MYMSPSFDAVAFTAAPYRGKGLGWFGVYVSRLCDHGYREALGLEAGGVFRSYRDNHERKLLARFPLEEDAWKYGMGSRVDLMMAEFVLNSLPGEAVPGY